MAQGRVRQGCVVGLLPLCLAVAAGSLPSGLSAQEPQEAPPAPPSAAATAKPRLEWGLEAKANFRNSPDNRFPVRFPFPPSQLPPGQTRVFEETVNAGSHIELSNVSLYLDGIWSEALKAHAKIDFLNLYERNPTSTASKLNVDEAWIRFGRETEHAVLAPGSGLYVKVGKFGKLERQNDRHLESYGLVSTAFNRLEDIGVEVGADLGRHLYLRGSYTAGNPVFMRDPNALAGDNGTPILLQPNPDPHLKSGIVILYDAKAQDIDLGHPQAGLGLGWRTADEEGRNGVDLLSFARRRRLAETGEIEGTFYHPDLDLLGGPFGLTPLPVHGDVKQEVGGNLWLYLGNLTLFGQYVDQKLAGLPRTGLEGELTWRFELPLVWSLGDSQLFPFVAPSVRYSSLDNKFRNHPLTPAPSFAWDWTKIDGGLRLGIVGATDLTVEYADNDFILGNGAHRHNDELLVTLRWRT